jgi:hypothetical protein
MMKSWLKEGASIDPRRQCTWRISPLALANGNRRTKMAGSDSVELHEASRHMRTQLTPARHPQTYSLGGPCQFIPV